MGADLFESFVGSIIAAAVLANGDTARIMLPFWVAGGGIVAALCGFFFVSTKEGASQKEVRGGITTLTGMTPWTASRETSEGEGRTKDTR